MEESTVPKFFYILAAVVIGGVLTLQPGLNADVARRLGNPFGAGLISILVSFIVLIAIVFGSRQPVAWSGALTMPWYLWLAGTIGVIFVVGTLWLAPILGATVLFVSIVAGQMIMATISDYTGFGGYASQSPDPWKLAGIALVLAGVWVCQRGT
jgi:transporter family-2 protein